jgi:hypothetical protein
MGYFVPVPGDMGDMAYFVPIPKDMGGKERRLSDCKEDNRGMRGMRGNLE